MIWKELVGIDLNFNLGIDVFEIERIMWECKSIEEWINISCHPLKLNLSFIENIAKYFDPDYSVDRIISDIPDSPVREALNEPRPTPCKSRELSIRVILNLDVYESEELPTDIPNIVQAAIYREVEYLIDEDITYRIISLPSKFKESREYLSYHAGRLKVYVLDRLKAL